MSIVESTPTTATELLESHPFATQYPGHLVNRLIGNFKAIAASEADVLSEYQHQPVDLIVGEDLSGRIPTLMSHYVLAIAQREGVIDRIPHVAFMASGKHKRIADRTSNLEYLWQDRLDAQALDITRFKGVNKAVVITEGRASGTSVNRIFKALAKAGVEDVDLRVAYQYPYLRSEYASDRDRAPLGVEKTILEARSHRRPDYDARLVSSFRDFLKFYAQVIYSQKFNACSSM